MATNPINQPFSPITHQRSSRSGIAVASIAAGMLLVLVAMLLPSSASATTVGPGDSVSVSNVPYSSEGAQCDESRDGWHLIMNGIETSSGEPPTAADFGPVTLQFSDSSTGSASFTDTSSKTAHFLDSTTNQSGPFTVTSATMTFPAGTTITSFNQFVISHPPCGTITTTTSTTEATTTTSPVSTETTSTTSPVSTETTSTVPVITTTPGGGGGPSDGLVTPEGEVVTQPVTIGTSGSTLPSTGLDGRPFIVTGLLLIASGAAVWLLRRRQAATDATS